MWISQCSVRSDDITSLTMATNQISDHLLFIPAANHKWSKILPVERMLQIVAHSSVNGDVSSGSPLNRDDAIQSKTDGCDQRTARLNEKVCTVANFLVQCPSQSLGVFAYAWCFVIVHIPHTQSAAKIVYAEPL